MVLNKKYLPFVVIFSSVMLFFLGLYKMFFFDGKARNCTGNNYFEYNNILSREEILALNRTECLKYWDSFDNWKYTTFLSIVIFISSVIYIYINVVRSNRVNG